VIIAGRSSVHSLYNTRLATYTEEDTFDHKASEGFIKIYGLPVKTYHQVEMESAGAVTPSELMATSDRKS